MEERPSSRPSPPPTTIASFRTQVTGEGALPSRWKFDSVPSTTNGGSTASNLPPNANGIDRNDRIPTPKVYISVEDLTKEEGLKFEGVFLNGLRSLRRVRIKNQTDGSAAGVGPATLLVRLSSTLGDQVHFQSSNSNLDVLDSLPSEIRHTTATNTVTAASHLPTLEGNALFDSVGFIREVTLQPGETREIVVSFRPDSAHLHTSLPPTSTPSDGPNGGSLLLPSSSNRPESIFSEAPLSSVSTSNRLMGGRNGLEEETNGPFHMVTIDGFLNLDASIISPPSSSSETEGSTLLAVQQLSIKLAATVCRSFFTVSNAKPNDPCEVFIDWGSACVVGESYVKEFEIVNRSGIELFWKLDDPEGIAELGMNANSAFLVADIEKGHWIGSEGSEWPSAKSLAPFSSRKLRFLFRPTEAKEVDAELSFENIGDSDNVVLFHFHASVSSAPRDSTLRLISGTSLDFGDCVAGEWSRQVIVFKNVHEVALEVTFAADKGIDATFRLEESNTKDGEEEEEIKKGLLMKGLDGVSIDANAVESVVPQGLDDIDLESGVGTSVNSETRSRTIIHELARTSRGTGNGTGYNRGSSPMGSILLPSSKQLGGQSRNTSQTDQIISTSPTSTEYTPENTGSHLSNSPPKTFHPFRQLVAGSNPSASSSSYLPSTTTRPKDSTDLILDANHSNTSSSISRPTTSNPFRAETTSRGLFRVQDHFKSFEQENANRIEDLYAKPGVEYRVMVSYRPSRATSLELDSDGGRLLKTNFRLTVSYRPWGGGGGASSGSGGGSGGGMQGSSNGGNKSVSGSSNIKNKERERKPIVCKARVCTSFIAVHPSVIDFGEVELGSSKSAMISIKNLSEIPARVDLRFLSKVLSAYRDEIVVPVGKTIEVRLDMVPRRTNMSYQKQVSCHNLLNPENSQVVQVKAVNVDTRGVAYHSSFYRLLTPSGGNFVDFGTVPLNSSSLRAITIQNISEDHLILDLASAHPEEYEIYTRHAESDLPLDPVPSLTDPAMGPGEVAVTPLVPSPVKPRREAPGELKERVLDAIFQQTPPPTSNGQQSTRRERDPSVSRGRSNATGESAPRIAASRLRDGALGKATQPYGIGVAFKDRSILSGSEYLDLASGPPLDIARTSPRSKRTLMYDTLQRATQPSRLYLPKAGSIARAAPFSTSPNSSDLPSESISNDRSTPPPAPLPTTPTKRKPGRIKDPSATSVSPALTARRRMRGMMTLPLGDLAKLSLDEVLTSLESHVQHPDSSELSSWELEDAYVRRHIALRRALTAAKNAGELEKVDTIELAAKSERTIYIIVHPTAARTQIQNTSRKQDGKLSIRMRSTEDTQIPYREVVLRWTTCRSAMDLGMAHINFGNIEKSSSKTKKVVIANTSDVSLLYSVRKSGSIASGDIKLAEGRHGVIPPYGRKEVSIVFTPHYAGPFEETIHVDNVEDGSDATVRMKAFIRKPPTFTVTPSSLDFGSCRLGEQCKVSMVSITNISRSQRTFTVASKTLATSRFLVEVILSVSAKSVLPTLTNEETDEVEQILQKLKISRRKGQPDKEQKYIDRLTSLHVPVPPKDVDLASPKTLVAVEGVAPLPAPLPLPAASLPLPPSLPSSVIRKSANSPPTALTFVLEPNSRIEIAVSVLARMIQPCPAPEAIVEGQPEWVDFVGEVEVSENVDTLERVNLLAKVMIGKEEEAS